MKALKLTLIIPLLLFAVSCKKAATTNTSTSISVDEAADMAAGAISVSSFGFASVADNISVNAQNVNSVNKGGQAVNGLAANAVKQACGTTLADSVSASGSTASVSYNYFYKYLRTLNCINNIHDNLVNTITFHGNFDGPRLSSADNGTASVIISGLPVTSANYVVNGTYTRNGAFTLKVGSKASGTSLVSITATNILLTKPNRVILSGGATITVSGTLPKGTFSYTGNLVFNGGNTATLTVGTNVYIIDLVTGTYVKQ